MAKKVSELAAAMDVAVDLSIKTQEALKAAEKVVETKRVEAQEARAKVESLHKEYGALMKEILSFGGTVHVAD